MCWLLPAFTVVPALMALIPDGAAPATQQLDKPFTARFAGVVQRYGVSVLGVTLLLIGLSVAGIRALEVENRFIDYFKKHTEIYQGMELRRAGDDSARHYLVGAVTNSETTEAGTEALDVADDDDWGDEDGFFDDGFGIDFGFGADDTEETGYWFSVPGRQLVDDVHRIIERRVSPEKYSAVDRLRGDGRSVWWQVRRG